MREYPVTAASEEAEVTPNTGVQAYQYFRDVCSTKLLQAPILLGGPGVIVQIDESLYRHKPKVSWSCRLDVRISLIILFWSLLQNHRGRATANEVWVFGLADTSYTPALGYMEVVQHRDAATLLPIIQAHTRPGTVIHSDEWAAYNNVQTLPTVAVHQTVNHSLEFVNSTTGAHTQNVESYWNRSKTKIKRMKGCHQQMIPSYLDEFMWRERHGRTASQALSSIICDIRDQYPV